MTEMELKYTLIKRIKDTFFKYWILPWAPFILLIAPLYADDNHVHVDQVNGGDNFDFTVDQYGYNNLIRFSFDHQNNTVNLDQIGNNLYIGYTDDWIKVRIS